MQRLLLDFTVLCEDGSPIFWHWLCSSHQRHSVHGATSSDTTKPVGGALNET